MFSVIKYICSNPSYATEKCVHNAHFSHSTFNHTEHGNVVPAAGSDQQSDWVVREHTAPFGQSIIHIVFNSHCMFS